MKKILLVLVVTISLGLSGCSTLNKDAEVNSFIKELNQLTTEIAGQVDKKTTEGVEKAQKALDDRKTDLKSKLDQLKGVRGFQLSRKMRNRFRQAIAKDLETVENLEIQYAHQAVSNPDFGKKLDRLTAEYYQIFRL